MSDNSVGFSMPDVGTTGLRPSCHDRIIEIGTVRTDHDALVDARSAAGPLRRYLELTDTASPRSAALRGMSKARAYDIPIVTRILG